MLSVIFHFHKSLLLLSHVIFLDEILLEYRKMRGRFFFRDDEAVFITSSLLIITRMYVRGFFYYYDTVAVGVAENF